jgi:hypothetical protein
MARKKKSGRRRRSPKLTSKRRRSLKKSQFGLPGQRKYPMDTRGRAANAKARAKQQRKRGRLSKSAYKRIVAKANRRLRKGK